MRGPLKWAVTSDRRIYCGGKCWHDVDDDKAERTGSWAIPDRSDVIALKSDVTRAKERISERF